MARIRGDLILFEWEIVLYFPSSARISYVIPSHSLSHFGDFRLAAQLEETAGKMRRLVECAHMCLTGHDLAVCDLISVGLLIRDFLLAGPAALEPLFFYIFLSPYS